MNGLASAPFGAEASPFILGATLQHHYNQQPEEVWETVQTLRENTYVDNLMKTGQGLEEMERFKSEATQILEEASSQLENAALRKRKYGVNLLKVE